MGKRDWGEFFMVMAVVFSITLIFLSWIHHDERMEREKEKFVHVCMNKGGFAIERFNYVKGHEYLCIHSEAAINIKDLI